MKKLVAAIALSLALAAALPLTAMAHGGKHAARHFVGDGHYHQICAVRSCTKTGSHSHNGVAYLPHTYGDGHRYHTSGNHHR
jgi:hypothetical protein